MYKTPICMVIGVVAFFVGGMSLGAPGASESPASREFPAASTSAKPPVLVNITRGKDDLHAGSMALALAQSAIKEGHPVVVFHLSGKC
jgi:hypothetical protein